MVLLPGIGSLLRSRIVGDMVPPGMVVCGHERKMVDWWINPRTKRIEWYLRCAECSELIGDEVWETEELANEAASGSVG